jgi:hypothetical protein
MKMLKYILIPLIAVFFVGCSLFNSGDDAKKYNPQEFPAAPSDAPFSISLDYDKIQQEGKSILKLQLNLHNDQSSPLQLSYLAAGPDRPYFQFIITGSDTSAVWKLLDVKNFLTAEETIQLDAGETKTFTYNWDYLKDEISLATRDKYLLFGGLYSLTVYEDTTHTSKINKSFEKIGVGRQPVTITTGQ